MGGGPAAQAQSPPPEKCAKSPRCPSSSRSPYVSCSCRHVSASTRGDVGGRATCHVATKNHFPPHAHSLLFENASILIDSDGPGRHSIDDHLSSETRRHRRGLKNQSLKLKRRFHEPDASRKRQTPFGWLITNRHRP